jgi:hypothetical protein
LIQIIRVTVSTSAPAQDWLMGGSSPERNMVGSLLEETTSHRVTRPSQVIEVSFFALMKRSLL